MTCSELVAQADDPAGDGGVEDGAARPGVLLLLADAEAVGLAVAVVDPGALGWLLLPEDAHPATVAAQSSAPAAKTSRADPERPRFIMPPRRNVTKPETTHLRIGVVPADHSSVSGAVKPIRSV